MQEDEQWDSAIESCPWLTKFQTLHTLKKKSEFNLKLASTTSIGTLERFLPADDTHWVCRTNYMYYSPSLLFLEMMIGKFTRLQEQSFFHCYLHPVEQNMLGSCPISTSSWEGHLPKLLMPFINGNFVAKLTEGNISAVWIHYTLEATENKALNP